MQEEEYTGVTSSKQNLLSVFCASLTVAALRWIESLCNSELRFQFVYSHNCPLSSTTQYLILAGYEGNILMPVEFRHNFSLIIMRRGLRQRK